jgi:predicted metal-binding protein
MVLLEDSPMRSNSLSEAVQRALPTPWACAGPCVTYGSRTDCPSLLVLAMLVKASKEIPACMRDRAAA